MHTKLSPILGGLILLGTLVGYLVLQQEEGSEQATADLLFSDLAERANQVNEITITDAQQILLAAKKIDGQWQATHVGKVFYPIEQNKLSELMQSMIRAKLREPKTAKPENHELLGLQALANQDSRAILIELTMDNQQSWQLLAGDRPSMGTGQFVRKPDQNQTWLLDRKLVLPLDSFEWLKSSILDIELAEVKSLTRTDNQGWEVVLDKVEAQETEGNVETTYKLDNMPVNSVLKYDTILKHTLEQVLDLGFEAMQSKDKTNWNQFEPVASLSLSLSTGKVIEIALAEFQDKSYVMMSGDVPQAYWQDWVYQLSDFNAGKLNKVIADFIDDPSESLPAVPETLPLDEGEAPE
jgi:hypothetical protein